MSLICWWKEEGKIQQMSQRQRKYLTQGNHVKEETVYLIDGSAYIYRAYHAIASLTNSNGLPTNAVFGFVNIIHRLLREKKPSHCAVAFDSRGPVFRHEMYKEYKANRPPMPEDLALQMPHIKSFVTRSRIPAIEVQGVEADDIIATAALYFKKQGCRVVIVSGDKDLLQLVDDKISMWEPMNNKLYTISEVEAKYKIKSENLLDFFALVGDSSDNVPGVPGVGPKTAEKLINEYSSLDGIYQGLDGMKKSKMKERLAENKESAYLSKELIRLKVDVDISFDLEDYKLGEENEEELQSFYAEMGFSRLLKSVKKAKPLDPKNFQIVISESGLKELKEELDQTKLIVVDTETTSLESRKADLVGVSIATSLDKAWYLPVGHRDEEGQLVVDQLDAETVKQFLLPYLQDEKLVKLGHNIKYDYTVFLQNYGVRLAGPLKDSMIAAYLIDPTRRSYKLDDLCLEHDIKLTPFDSVVDDVKREGCFAYVEVEKAGHYSCEDVYGALMLWNEYQVELEKLDLEELFTDIEMPLVPILADMERLGVQLDLDVLRDLSDEFSGKLATLEREIHILAGEEFNINSPKQLGRILFEELRLPHGRKTKTGYSTDMKILEKLAPKHDLPAKVMEYRSLAKLLSTYVEKLGDLRDDSTGRVYTSFNQTVTATGRLSSSNPNLQNIPIRTEDGNRIRQAFVPSEGKVFISADYSQVDLRVLAHYSEDEALQKAFNSGEDIHARTAAEIFSVSPLLMTSEMRRIAKSINFGIVYGMSAYGLSSQLGISRKEAQTFIDRYFTLYSGVKTFMVEVVEQAREDGFVTTLCHRRRAVPEIDAKNKNVREFAERTALNTPIQGTAADIIKLAMIKVKEVIDRENLPAELLLQIHDELVFEVPEDDVDRCKGKIIKAMESALLLDVPLVVNVEIGRNLAKGS
jgi:DNA polymerase I